MQRIALTAAFLLLTAGLLAQDAPSQARLDPALAPLQGTWVISSINGQPLSVEMALVIKGDKYEQVVDGSVDERGGVKVDAKKTPMAIDLSIAEGNDAGKLQVGIVEVGAGGMKLKLNVPAAPARPTAFGIEDGFLMVEASLKKF
jgi:uncharacterized protein (TIGR03067 family)